MTHNLFASAVFGFLAGYIQAVILSKTIIENQPKESFLRTEADYIQTILPIAAAVIRADSKSAQPSIAFIEKKLLQEFSPEYTQKAVHLLRTEINQPTNLQRHTTRIAADFDSSSKIQLLHFLVSITTVDGMLTQAEHKILQQICQQIQLPYTSLDTLLAMFRFRREQDQHSQNRSKTVSYSLLENAYSILGIKSTAGDQDVKKAYKKLAVIHHPDKVAHLGEDAQKASAEKFKAIAGAYDIICKKRGIV